MAVSCELAERAIDKAIPKAINFRVIFFISVLLFNGFDSIARPIIAVLYRAVVRFFGFYIRLSGTSEHLLTMTVVPNCPSGTDPFMYLYPAETI